MHQVNKTKAKYSWLNSKIFYFIFKFGSLNYHKMNMVISENKKVITV